MKTSLSLKWFNILLCASLIAALAISAQPVATAHATATNFNVNLESDIDVCDINVCTLRGAINAANANPGADTIAFTIDFTPVTITLTSGLPPITEGLTIDAATKNITIDGASLFRPFKVNTGVTLTLNHLTIQNGFPHNEGGPYGAAGGAIYNQGTLNVFNSTFKTNTSAGYGGAILSEVGPVTIANSTFSGNSAGTNGGAIFVVNGSIPSVLNSTFSGNATSSTIFIESAAITLINTIIANSGVTDCILGFAASVGIGLNNLIEQTGGNACGLVNGTDGNIIGSSANLGSLASNGGVTQTFALLAGSPAINKGDNTTCNASPVSNKDQTGKDRFPNGGATCDIGAYEVWDTTAPSTQIDSGPALFTNSTSASITFSATDDFSAAGNIKFVCNSDLSPSYPDWYDCTSPQDFSGIPEGNHTIVVYAVDEVGNPEYPTLATHDWTVDLTAPTATINVKPTNPTMKALATFNFSATDNVTSAPNFLFDCKLDSGSFAPCNSGAKNYTVANGSHTFKVRAKDQAGNLSPQVSYTWVAGAKNAGFNTYTGTSKVPTSWTATNFKIGDGKDLATKKEGTASVVILGAASLTKSFQQTITVSGGALEKFTFSFWVKGSLIPATGICRAQIMFYKNLTLVQTKFVDCPIGTYAFLNKSVVFNTSAAYNKITIQFISSKATGKVWFDLVNLKK